MTKNQLHNLKKINQYYEIKWNFEIVLENEGCKPVYKHAKDDMKLLGLQPEWDNIQGYVDGLDMGQTSNPSLAWKKKTFSK